MKGLKINGLFGAALLSAALLLTACNSKPKGTAGNFKGEFVTAFGDRFVLNDDYSAEIQFDKQDTVFHTSWGDGPDHDRAYANIGFNGNSAYFYVRDGKLYYHKGEMEQGKNGVDLQYK